GGSGKSVVGGRPRCGGRWGRGRRALSISCSVASRTPVAGSNGSREFRNCPAVGAAGSINPTPTGIAGPNRLSNREAGRPLAANTLLTPMPPRTTRALSVVGGGDAGATKTVTPARARPTSRRYRGNVTHNTTARADASPPP